MKTGILTISAVGALLATRWMVAFGAFAQTGGAVSTPVRTLELLRHAHAVPPDFNSYWEGEIARQRKEVPLAVAAVKRTWTAAVRRKACSSPT